MFKKIYPIIITLIFALMLAVMLLSFTGVLPDFWTIVTQRDDSAPFDGEIPQFLSELDEQQQNKFAFSLSQKDMQGILQFAKAPEYLQWNYVVSRFWDEHSSNTVYRVQAHGDYFKITYSVDGYDGEESVTARGNELVFENSDGNKNTLYADEAPSFREYSGITEQSRFETLTEQEIDTIHLENIKLADSSYKDTVFVKTYNESQNRTEYYWFSMRYGVMMRAQYYEGQNLIYSMETLSVSADAFEKEN